MNFGFQFFDNGVSDHLDCGKFRHCKGLVQIQLQFALIQNNLLDLLIDFTSGSVLLHKIKMVRCYLATLGENEKSNFTACPFLEKIR